MTTKKPQIVLFSLNDGISNVSTTNDSEPRISESSVVIHEVSKSYRRGPETIEVLRSVSLKILPGEFVAIMGPSGSGKTTLLNIIAGLDQPDSGSIMFGEIPIDRLGEGQLARWRNHYVGFIFQHSHLIPVLTAAQNVELPLLVNKLKRVERKRRVDAAITLVGLMDRSKHRPKELSGGQEQRVGIARAIINNPSLLICDEPTGNLDRNSGIEILDLLTTLNRDYGTTIILVTHDDEASARAQRRFFLSSGELEEMS